MAGKQAKILSDGNVRALLTYARKTRNAVRNRALVLLSVKAGLRAGEMRREIMKNSPRKRQSTYLSLSDNSNITIGNTNSRGSKPARYPAGPWPIELPLDMVAAFFGHTNTATFIRAVKAGEAPKATARRGTRGEPLWCRVACERFVERRHAVKAQEHFENDIGDLV